MWKNFSYFSEKNSCIINSHDTCIHIKLNKYLKIIIHNDAFYEFYKFHK